MKVSNVTFLIFYFLSIFFRFGRTAQFNRQLPPFPNSYLKPLSSSYQFPVHIPSSIFHSLNFDKSGLLISSIFYNPYSNFSGWVDRVFGKFAIFYDSTDSKQILVKSPLTSQELQSRFHKFTIKMKKKQFNLLSTCSVELLGYISLAPTKQKGFTRKSPYIGHGSITFHVPSAPSIQEEEEELLLDINCVYRALFENWRYERPTSSPNFWAVLIYCPISSPLHCESINKRIQSLESMSTSSSSSSSVPSSNIPHLGLDVSLLLHYGLVETPLPSDQSSTSTPYSLRIHPVHFRGPNLPIISSSSPSIVPFTVPSNLLSSFPGYPSLPSSYTLYFSRHSLRFQPSSSSSPLSSTSSSSHSISSSPPRAVCLVLPYSSIDPKKGQVNSALLFEWIRYYLKLGFYLFIYDRDGQHASHIFPTLNSPSSSSSSSSPDSSYSFLNSSTSPLDQNYQENQLKFEYLKLKHSQFNSSPIFSSFDSFKHSFYSQFLPSRLMYHGFTMRGILDPKRRGMNYDNEEESSVQLTTNTIANKTNPISTSTSTPPSLHVSQEGVEEGEALLNNNNIKSDSERRERMKRNFEILGRRESQDHDKTLTLTHCRFEARALYGIERVLVVDSDEFLYCPPPEIHTPSSFSSQTLPPACSPRPFQANSLSSSIDNILSSSSSLIHQLTFPQRVLINRNSLHPYESSSPSATTPTTPSSLISLNHSDMKHCLIERSTSNSPSSLQFQREYQRELMRLNQSDQSTSINSSLTLHLLPPPSIFDCLPPIHHLPIFPPPPSSSSSSSSSSTENNMLKPHHLHHPPYLASAHSVKSFHLSYTCPLTNYHHSCPPPETPRLYDCLCHSSSMARVEVSVIVNERERIEEEGREVEGERGKDKEKERTEPTDGYLKEQRESKLMSAQVGCSIIHFSSSNKHFLDSITRMKVEKGWIAPPTVLSSLSSLRSHPYLLPLDIDNEHTNNPPSPSSSSSFYSSSSSSLFSFAYPRNEIWNILNNNQ